LPKFSLKYTHETNDSRFGVSVPHPRHEAHPQESLKDEDLKIFVYTSDTGFSDDFRPFAKDAALLLVECSFRRNKPVQKHLVEV